MSLPERWRGKWSQTPTVVLRFHFLLASVTLPQVMNGSSFLYPGSASSTEGKSVGLRRSSKYSFRHLTYILSWNWQHPYHKPQVSELPEDLLESLWGWLKVLMHALTKHIQVFASEPHFFFEFILYNLYVWYNNTVSNIRHCKEKWHITWTINNGPMH